jgi:hypothetical protein
MAQETVSFGFRVKGSIQCPVPHYKIPIQLTEPPIKYVQRKGTEISEYFIELVILSIVLTLLSEIVGKN